MSGSAGAAQFAISFQLSPIILTGGVADSISGGMMPIISLTQSQQFPTGILGAGVDLSFSSYFCYFEPLQSTSMIDNDVGMYPFANQSVAANAIIAKPLTISLLMICPARDTMPYFVRLQTLMSLQSTFAQHNAMGGLYTVLTPSYYYTSCIMVGMRDMTAGESKQAQIMWQIDFIQPLVTLDQAAQAQSALMSKLTDGSMVQGQPAWSGVAPNSGYPNPMVTPQLLPVGSGAAGTGVAPSPSTSPITILA